MISIAILMMCSAPPDAAGAESSASTTVSQVLFVFEGRNAILTPLDSSILKMVITIRRSDHLVTWFTDRPARDAGHITMEAFVSLWDLDTNDSFKTDPPNIALELNGETLIATMTKPRIRSSNSGVKKLVAELILVKPKALAMLQASDRGIAAHAKRARGNAQLRSIRASQVSCFVDDFVTGVAGVPDQGWMANASCKTLMQYYGLCYGDSSNGVCPCPP